MVQWSNVNKSDIYGDTETLRFQVQSPVSPFPTSLSRVCASLASVGPVTLQLLRQRGDGVGPDWWDQGPQQSREPPFLLSWGVKTPVDHYIDSQHYYLHGRFRSFLGFKGFFFPDGKWIPIGSLLDSTKRAKRRPKSRVTLPAFAFVGAVPGDVTGVLSGWETHWEVARISRNSSFLKKTGCCYSSRLGHLSHQV